MLCSNEENLQLRAAEALWSLINNNVKVQEKLGEKGIKEILLHLLHPNLRVRYYLLGALISLSARNNANRDFVKEQGVIPKLETISQTPNLPNWLGDQNEKAFKTFLSSSEFAKRTSSTTGHQNSSRVNHT